jgi:antibiotic biosynthesis monooxygenase (ABM) superfamily enzyme
LLESLLLLLYLAIFAFITVPGGLNAFNRWLKTKNPKHASGVALFGFLNIYIVSLIEIDLIRLVYKFDYFISHGFNRAIIDLCLVLVVYYLTIPSSLRFFNHWKVTKKTKDFALMAILAILSVNALSIVFVTLIPFPIPL